MTSLPLSARWGIPPHSGMELNGIRGLGLSASLLAGRIQSNPPPRSESLSPWSEADTLSIMRCPGSLPLYWRQCNSSILTEKGTQLSREPTPDFDKMHNRN